MKTLYFGEIKKTENGGLLVDDVVLDWQFMPEDELVKYMASWVRIGVERMKADDLGKSMLLELKLNEISDKEVKHD